MEQTTKAPRKTRAAVRPISKSAADIAANAAAEKARKAASKKALRESLKAEKAGKAEKADKRITQVVEQDAAALESARAAEYAANAVRTAEADAAALGVPVEQVLADMGLNPDGTPAVAAKSGYFGPMLALKTAVKRYVKAANGQPCNGDEVAILCGQYSRETVVKALIAALGLGHNPYAHLNPGQQSMNLRNKARHAVRSGLIRLADIDACLRAHSAATVAA